MSLDIPDCQKTEYGTIPSDWLIGELRNILAFQCGAPFASLHFRKDGIGVRLIRNRDLKSNDDIVSYDGIYEPNYVVKNGDVLVSMDGDFIPCCWNNGEALLNQRVGRVLPKGGNLAKYLYYILVTPLRRKQEGTGATTVKHLSHSDVEKLVVPYTLNIQEQRAIATALSDVDALIEAKRVLLEKKRAIKQGTMQELLTGKLRLPGFPVTPMKHTEIGVLPEDWEVKTLGEIGVVKMCKRIFKHETSAEGDVPFFKIGTFGQPPDAYISREKFNAYRSLYPYPQKGTPLISAAGTIGRVVVYDGQDAYYQDSNIVWLEHEEKDILNAFLRYYYSVINWVTETGSAITRLYNNNILSSQVALPTMKEQAAIASVLADIDSEIATLEQALEKLVDLKQGMMQNLLTGRIRLV